MANPGKDLIVIPEGGDLAISAVASECAPTLDPGPAVILRVHGTTADGAILAVNISIPASGVQSLRRNLRVAHAAIPLELRQEND